ncbi:MAG: XisI protein [Xenococcaceae cyanobacterium]
MDKLESYRQIIKQVLTEYAAIPYKYGDIASELIVSNDENRFILITQGWEDHTRVHGCVVHLDIINGKIWIQRDGTEDGIATDLEAAGIPKSDIVLAFHPQRLRKYTEYAVS